MRLPINPLRPNLTLKKGAKKKPSSGEEETPSRGEDMTKRKGTAQTEGNLQKQKSHKRGENSGLLAEKKRNLIGYCYQTTKTDRFEKSERYPAYDGSKWEAQIDAGGWVLPGNIHGARTFKGGRGHLPQAT